MTIESRTMRRAFRAAIVTGASSGLGAELARQLANAGVQVGLTARRVPELDSLARSIRDRGGTAVVAAADAADRSLTRAAIERLEGELGPIDLLIANAGLGLATRAAAFDAGAFERMVGVNLLGASYAIEAVLPGMLDRRRGHLVGISSLASYRGLPGSAGYSATKAGLSTLLEGLRIELQGVGIDVTTVHPGYVRTPMTAGADHPLPFLVEVEPAARIILRGVSSGRRTVAFPLPLAACLALVRLLPDSLYDPLARLFLPREGRDGE